MKKDKLISDSFFDLSTCSFREIFEGALYIWEVLPKIQSFITTQFEKGTVIGNFRDKKNVFIGEGTTVHKDAEIIGPAIIGKNCVIGHNALLRENCLLGDSVRVGNGAEIKNSILLNNSVAAHLNYVGDSIIGNNVNISGGAMLANFRFDKKPVVVNSEGGIVDTGMIKFGAVVGDGSVIGVNAVLNPGTILGKNTIIYPLLSVKGVHKDGEVLK